MKKFIVLAALGAALIGTASLAVAQEPDANGDYHSNCHTGSKFRGAGGNDKGEDCTPSATAVATATATETPKDGATATSTETSTATPESGNIGGANIVPVSGISGGSEAVVGLPDTGDGTCASGC